MKKTFIMLSFLSMCFLAFCFCTPNPGDDDKIKTIIRNVRLALAGNHYSPALINDEFSRKAFDKYFESIDPTKRFLLANDIDYFKKDYDNLDDFFKNEELSFYHSTVDTLFNRIVEAEKYATVALEKPFDFTVNESYTIKDSLRDFAANKEGAKESWRKYMKYNVMMELIELQEDSTNVDKSVEELEVKARAEVKDIIEDYFRRLKQRKKSHYLSFYVNAFTEQFDPHTNYLSPTDKEDFDVSMSGQLEGIGARLQDKKGYATIAELVIGGPAWKSKKIEVGDQITKVQQGKDGEAVNIVGMLIDEAIRLIRGKKGTEVILTIRKKDGSTETVNLIRDVIEYDETFARSAVILDEKGEKYGIIYLPEFYTNLNNRNGRDPSIDITREINELQKEGIKGLIFDIRNNGGGSLEEVVEIAGLFIKKGPIVQVKRTDGFIKIHEDKDPAIIYDGPLVVMVNELSASASEIFAAAMQDYKRGIVVGSPSTFGKGTVQTFWPLDGRGNTDVYGALKLTIQKFYRVNGGSTQLKGVKSDIVMPDQYTYLGISESARSEALAWDQMAPLKYEIWQNPVDVETIKTKSEQRLSKNPYFALLDESARYFKAIDKTRNVPLNIEAFKAERQQREKELKRFEVFDEYNNNLSFKNLTRDEALVKEDSTLLARRTEWHKNLGKDIYLEESLFVLKDIQ